MIPCSSLIQNFFKHDDWKIQLLSKWPEIVGDLSTKMRLEEIKNDMLIIGVYESAWLQELFLLSSVIKKIINRSLGQDKIKTLRFKHASTKQSMTLQPTQAAPTHINCPKIVLNNKEAIALQKIKDTELQEALHAFLSSCHYRKLHQ